MRTDRAGRAGVHLAWATLALFLLLLLRVGPACEGRESELPELRPPRFPTTIDAPEAVALRERPDLVVVSLDTLRADRLSAYGHDRPTSPAFDRLAEASTLFEHAYAHSPKTAPSHMTLFTGLYPEAHRVRNRFAGAERQAGRLSEDLPTLAEMLGAAGYRSLGRTGGGNVEGGLGFARGFESYRDVLLEPEPLFAKALEEIEGLAAEDRPFFYFLHTYAIHSPYLPPEPYRSQFVSPDYAGGIVSDPEALGGDALRYGEIHRAFWSRVDRSSAADRRHLLDLYDAGIRHVDDALGHLWDGLARLDAAERPIVVVLSDHGEQFGEHGGFEHHALWQEVLHVPLVIHVPSAVRTGWAGRRVETPVGLVDVLPTLLELLGLPVPSHVQGDSLVPLVEAGSPFRPWLFAQLQYTGDAALRAGPWKLLRTGDEEQIFDLARDPGERRARPGTPDLRLRVGEQLDRVLAASRAYHAFADEGAAVELDAGARERLEALGYVDPAAP